MNVRHLIVAGVTSLAALSAVACGSGGSGGSSASAAPPGFTTSCKVTGLSGTVLEYDVSVTATQAADVTDVDVEFLKDGAGLSTEGQSPQGISDGGDGILMSAASSTTFPVFLAAGKSWKFSPYSDDDNLGPPWVYPSAGSQAFSVMPDSCEVIAVATTANPGNW